MIIRTTESVKYCWGATHALERDYERLRVLNHKFLRSVKSRECPWPHIYQETLIFCSSRTARAEDRARNLIISGTTEKVEFSILASLLFQGQSCDWKEWDADT